MSIILTHRHFLVYPNELVQEVEWTPKSLQVGDLISSEEVNNTIEPGGKFLVKRIVDVDPGELPHIRKYYLETF